MALDVDSETFVVYMAIQKQEEMTVDSDKKAQIKAQIKTQGRVLSKA